MGTVMKCVLMVVAVLAIACRANPTTGEREPDWPLIASELSLVQGDLTDLAPLFIDPQDAEGAAIIKNVNAILFDLESGIRQHLESGEPIDAHDIFTRALEQLPEVIDIAAQGSEKVERLQRIVAGARILVRHYVAVAGA